MTTAIVPVPGVTALPPTVPWWEWVLIAALVATVVLYAVSLARAWRRRRNHHDTEDDAVTAATADTTGPTEATGPTTPTATTNRPNPGSTTPTATRRRLSGSSIWALPLIVVLAIAVFQADTGWKEHRDDLATARGIDVDSAAAELAAALGDAYGVTVDKDWISVVEFPSRESDIVRVTMPDGSLADCWLWVEAVDGQRMASLEINTCREA